MNEVQIRGELPFDRACKGPLLATDRLTFRCRSITHRQHILRTRRIIHRIALSSVRSQQNMAKRPVISLHRGSEVPSHQTTDLLAIRTVRSWKVRAQALRSIYVMLPAEPCNHVSLTHEETIVVFPRATIHEIQNSLPAAIRNLEEHGAVSTVHLFGFEKVEVCGELDLPLRIPIGLVKIDDLLIVSVIRSDLEIHASFDLLVRTSQAEGLSVSNIRSR